MLSNRLTAIIKYTIVLFAIVSILSCQKEEITFDGPYHVRFTDSLLSLKESVAEPVKISIHNAGPIIDEDITVKYSIKGTARENVDYTVKGTKGEVVIPAGESFGYINLSLINNANNIIESQNLTFTIDEVSPNTLNIGRSKNGLIGRSFTLIIEDDCILSGLYKAYPPDSLASALPAINNISVTSNDCNEYRISNWDIYVTSYFPFPSDLIFIDNGDNSITIPEQEEENLNEAKATMRGTGVVNPTNRRITLYIEFVDYPEEPIRELTFYPQ